MELLQNFFLNLIKEAKSNGISEKKILSYLGIQESNQFLQILSQDDLLNSQESLTEAWLDIPCKEASNTKLLANSLSGIVIQAIVGSKKSKHNVLADQIKDYINTRKMTNKKFAEEVLATKIEGGMSEASFCKLLMNLSSRTPHSFQNRSYEKIAVIEELINQSLNESSLSSNIDHLDIYSYLNEKQPEYKLTPKEITSLLGSYIMFNKASYIDNERPISITNFHFLRDKANKNVIKFYFISTNNDGTVFQNEGIVIRDAHKSLQLLGFQKNSEHKNIKSMINLGLSATKEALENGKGYLNGGFFRQDESDNKPLHTWVHLSKINDLNKISGELASIRQRVKEYSNFQLNINSFVIIKTTDYLAKDNKLTRLLNKELKQNYLREPTGYILDKLYLTSPPPKTDQS